MVSLHTFSTMKRAERLMTAINQLNLSGYQIQKDIGISQGTITGYRRGTAQPREKTIEHFCRKYGVNKQWILTGEGDMMGGRAVPSKTIRFVKVIEQVKIEFDLTNKDVTDKLGVYSSLVSELKAGKTSVKDEWIETMVSVYGVNKEYILDGSGGIFIEQNTEGRSFRELVKEVEMLRQMVSELKKDKSFLQSVIDKNNLRP
jgi:hypothetical protein